MLLALLLLGLTLYFCWVLFCHADIKKRTLGALIGMFAPVLVVIIPTSMLWIVPTVDILDYKLPIANIDGSPAITKFDAGTQYLTDTYIVIVGNVKERGFRELGIMAGAVKIKKEKNQKNFELEIRSRQAEFPWNLLALNLFGGINHYVILAPEDFEIPK